MTVLRPRSSLSALQKKWCC